MESINFSYFDGLNRDVLFVIATFLKPLDIAIAQKANRAFKNLTLDDARCKALAPIVLTEPEKANAMGYAEIWDPGKHPHLLSDVFKRTLKQTYESLKIKNLLSNIYSKQTLKIPDPIKRKPHAILTDTTTPYSLLIIYKMSPLELFQFNLLTGKLRRIVSEEEKRELLWFPPQAATIAQFGIPNPPKTDATSFYNHVFQKEHYCMSGIYTNYSLYILQCKTRLLVMKDSHQLPAYYFELNIGTKINNVIFIPDAFNKGALVVVATEKCVEIYDDLGKCVQQIDQVFDSVALEKDLNCLVGSRRVNGKIVFTVLKLEKEEVKSPFIVRLALSILQILTHTFKKIRRKIQALVVSLYSEVNSITKIALAKFMPA